MAALRRLVLKGDALRSSMTSVRRPLPRIASVALVVIFAVAWMPGCSWTGNEKIKVAANGEPEYQNLQISYDLASTPELKRLDQPSSVEQTSSVEPASNNQISPPATRPWTRRRVHLELQYPYPGVHPAFARATLRIVTDTKKTKPEDKPITTEWKDAFSGTSVTYSQHSPGGMSAPKPAAKPEPAEPSKLPPEDQEDLAATEEVLYIDLPKTEIDELLTELAKADFFKQPSNPDGASHLSVAVNKGRCEKGWVREDRLDRLVDLLRRHGAPLPAPAAEAKKS
jgi:hypothetical protein